MEDIFFCVQSESATSFTTLFSTTPWQTITSQWLGFQTIWATKRSFIEFHRAATFSTRYRFIFIRYAVRGEAPTFHQIQSCHNSRSSFLFHHPPNPPPSHSHSPILSSKSSIINVELVSSSIYFESVQFGRTTLIHRRKWKRPTATIRYSTVAVYNIIMIQWCRYVLSFIPFPPPPPPPPPRPLDAAGDWCCGCCCWCCSIPCWYTFYGQKRLPVVAEAEAEAEVEVAPVAGATRYNVARWRNSTPVGHLRAVATSPLIYLHHHSNIYSERVRNRLQKYSISTWPFFSPFFFFFFFFFSFEVVVVVESQSQSGPNWTRCQNHHSVGLKFLHFIFLSIIFCFKTLQFFFSSSLFYLARARVEQFKA